MSRENASALSRQALMEQVRLLSLSLPALLLVGFVVLVPIAWLFWLSFQDATGFTLVHYQRILHPSYGLTLQTTFELAFLVTALCVLLSYPLAYLAAQLSPAGARLVLMCVLFPFWTSLLVRTYAWLVLLQRRGIVNTLLIEAGLIERPLALVYNVTGTVIGMVHVMVPFLILPLYASMRGIDGNLMRASMGLGASPTRAFRSVFLPLSLPGLIAGAMMVFVMSIGFFVTPVLLGGGKVNMIAQRIEQSVSLFPTWGPAAALAVVLLVLTVGFLGAGWLVVRRIERG